MNQQKRVVVTGLGAVTPLGLNVSEFWQGLIDGRNGIAPITAFDAANYPIKIIGEVKGFDPEKYMPLKRVDRTSRVTHFALAAARMAVESAKLDLALENKERIGTVIGSGGMPALLIGMADTFKNKGPNRIDPLIGSKISAHVVAVHVGMEFGLRGPNTTVNSACASGSDAIGAALDHIRMGRADVVITGGTDATVTPITIAAMNIVGALTKNPDPDTACRPFDLNRSGFVFGEGAGMLVLESYEHAISRGARIMAEIAGVGWTFDAYNETAPYAEMQAKVMKNALQDAGLQAEDVDYINAHGTSTRLNDSTETKAIKMVFGPRAYKIPISSNKSMIGHLVAAAGAVEAIATVLTLIHDIIPPTIHYQTPDPECDLDYVPNKARPQRVEVALSNSFGLGGQNCCLIFKRAD